MAIFHVDARSNRQFPFAETPTTSQLSFFTSEIRRERFLAGILKWLMVNISMFEPPQEDDVEADAPEVVLPDRSRKAFGELGAALRLAHRVPALAKRPEIEALRIAWLDMAARRNIFFDAARRIHLFPHRAVALSVIKELDRPAADIVDVLQEVLDRRWIDRTERSAWHKLDLKYYFDAAGLRHVFPDNSELFEKSSLATLPALPYATRSDLYGVTHLVFHLGDFGRCDLQKMGGRQRWLSLIDYVRGALAMCLHDRDFDLVAELMINRICLGRTPDALDFEATEALCESQDSSGFLPDLAWLAGIPAHGDLIQQEEAKFFAVYHPTVVGLFLVATDMDEQRATQESI